MIVARAKTLAARPCLINAGGQVSMPNDAKLGLFVGVAVVVALAIIYRGHGTEAPPEAAVQAPKRLATPNGADSSGTPPAKSVPQWPSFPEGEVDKVSGKEDAPERINRQSDAADQH
jgi:hypothetical protein